jgi:hypothetical protein
MLLASGHRKEMLSDDEPVEVDTTTSMVDGSAYVTFDCPDNRSIMQFRWEDRLNVHRLLGLHKARVPSFRLIDKVIVMYKDGLERAISTSKCHI